MSAVLTPAACEVPTGDTTSLSDSHGIVMKLNLQV